MFRYRCAGPAVVALAVLLSAVPVSLAEDVKHLPSDTEIVPAAGGRNSGAGIG